MLDWVNIVLRTVMCLAFLVLVVRPMMLSLVRREPSQEALEELAESAVESAFKAWRHNDSAPAYYHDPHLALLVVQNPDVANLPPEPTPQEKAQAEAAQAQAAQAQAQSDTSAQAQTAPAATAALAVPAGGEAAPSVASVATAADTDVDARAGASGQSPEDVEQEELDPSAQLKQMRDRMKQEQKKAAKPTIPAELLDNANSYEDKLALVRMIVSQEHDRVAATIRRMVQAD